MYLCISKRKYLLRIFQQHLKISSQEKVSTVDISAQIAASTFENVICNAIRYCIKSYTAVLL